MITLDTIQATKEEMKSVYLADEIPWVIGWSGGKDSTTVLQLAVEMLLELPESNRRKTVHVVSSDTLIEAPYVANYVKRNLDLLEQAALRLGLPLVVKQVTPEIEDSFFVNLIGKGYPAPNRWFRWCTERLKINPTTRYIERQVQQSGKVLILLGARKSESATRAQIMTKHRLSGSKFRVHTTIPNALIYAPIEDWETDDVWRYLTAFPSPWGGDNRELRNLYREANGGECPLVIDLSTPSCGNSRFGCWTCTVITDDKSMQGFIEAGQTELQPMLDFRNWLKELRDNPEAREKQRRNGQEGLGPFNFETRKEILRRLLRVQKEVGTQLIRNDELELIRSHWIQDGYPANAIREILAEYGLEGRWMTSEDGVAKERRLLEAVAEEFCVDVQVIDRLMDVEQRQRHKRRRHGIQADIDAVIASVSKEDGSSSAS